MQIHNAIITGSFSYNGADLSNVTSSNAYSASLSSRTTDLESTSSVLVGASSSFSSILSSVSSSQQQISASLLQVSASYISLSGSYNTFSGSASTRVTQIEQVYATTGSNSFRATQSITGSLTVTGQIIAQTINVQQVTSSIIYSSGSNNFGCDLNSRQTFTGSMFVTGAANFSNCVIIGGALSGTSATFSSSVNIGTAGIEKLNIFGSGSQFINVKNTTSNADMFVGMSSALAAAFIGTGGTDPIVFSTAGSEKMRINSCGNMGINVSCPANLLHLAGASATPSLRLGSISTGFHWDIGRENATTGDFLFNNANGGCTFERLRITTCGNVGIGTCSPATKLTVYPVIGAISGINDAIRLQVQSYLDAGKNTIVWAQDSSNVVLARFGLEWNVCTTQMNFIWRDVYNSITGSTELMRLTGGGNLGIGISSPAEKIHVFGSSGATSPRILIQSHDTANATAGLSLYGRDSSNVNKVSEIATSGSDLTISVNSAERMRITSAGYVGIGTNCPTREMVLYRSSGEVHFKLANGTTGQGQADGFDMAIDSAGAGYFLQREIQPISFYTSAAERMRINSCGGVRVGNPTAFNEDIRFNVYGTGVWDGANIGLQNGGSGGKDWIIFSTMCAFGQGAGNLLFYNNSGPTANALIIYANGNYDFGGSDVSDARLKQCIQNLNYGVNEIMQLSPKSYNLKSEDNLQQENQTVLRKRYGFIAQQVQPILPDTITGQETETDYLGLDYNGVLAVAVKAIQEQQCTICSQATIINQLKTCLRIN